MTKRKIIRLAGRIIKVELKNSLEGFERQYMTIELDERIPMEEFLAMVSVAKTAKYIQLDGKECEIKFRKEQI